MIHSLCICVVVYLYMSVYLCLCLYFYFCLCLCLCLYQCHHDAYNEGGKGGGDEQTGKDVG